MESKKTMQSGFLLAALGLVYGDIGTSPLYVLKYIVNESGGAGAVSEAMVLGALSLILWAILLLATVKGVLLLLRVDNQGEGGQLALFALVRERGKWLVLPAALGCAALLADSVLTPALTITAAVEGVRTVPLGRLSETSAGVVVAAALILITALFSLQGLGIRRTGRFLGPVMLIWFLFIGIAGFAHIAAAPAALRAFNPVLGIRFLFSADNSVGFALLGLVFLSVAGTEILYANLDFSGRRAITRSWPFVLVCLCLSYLGQGAWLLSQIGSAAFSAGAELDPFFRMLPGWLRLPAVLAALAAAWAAAQAVVNGSFTLASEAIRLDLLPALEIRYPSDSIRYEYIPAVNLLMWLFSCAAVLLFRSGQRMASVYGLTIAVAMLTTTVMLFVYYRGQSGRTLPVLCLLTVFGALEACFLAASMSKLFTGGIVTALLTLLLLFAMLAWNRGTELEKKYRSRLKLRDYIPQLRELRADAEIARIADNLVYMDAGEDMESVDQGILYSILDRDQKRAQTYWFVSVNTVGEPYSQRYQLESFGTDFAFRLKLELGFKCSLPLTWYLRDIFRDLEEQGMLLPSGKQYCLSEESALGTFRYCILRSRASDFDRLSLTEMWAMRIKAVLQSMAGLREEWYAEENTDVSVEYTPLLFEEGFSAVRIQRARKEEDAAASLSAKEE